MHTFLSDASLSEPEPSSLGRTRPPLPDATISWLSLLRFSCRRKHRFISQAQVRSSVGWHLSGGSSRTDHRGFGLRLCHRGVTSWRGSVTVSPNPAGPRSARPGSPVRPSCAHLPLEPQKPVPFPRTNRMGVFVLLHRCCPEGTVLTHGTAAMPTTQGGAAAAGSSPLCLQLTFNLFFIFLISFSF